MSARLCCKQIFWTADAIRRLRVGPQIERRTHGRGRYRILDHVGLLLALASFS